MDLKIERLMYAMASHEGWKPSGTTPTQGGSASYRRHNPGNLRSSPFMVRQENNFAVFETDMDGFAAFKWDIMQKARGNTSSGLNGNSTLADLIRIWAPPEDKNNVEAYIQSVLTKTGFSRNMRLADLL